MESPILSIVFLNICLLIYKKKLEILCAVSILDSIDCNERKTEKEREREYAKLTDTMQ